MSKVSVVLLCYNKFLETTSRCLASLAQDPDFGTWDVILVDNGSEPETKAALRKAQEHYPRVRFVFLEQNVGFPGGMNAGLRTAEGDLLILVSSDILVPSGTVGRLASVLNAKPDTGLVGPVTNAAGNEQRIFIPDGSTVSETLELGCEYADAGGPDCVSAYRLDFCSVGIRRTTYDAVGPLDEGFNPGYYEDFDYSLRANKAGFNLLVAENAFVYHQGGATFGSRNKEAKALMKRNKQRLLAKHGPAVSLPHTRDTNLAVLAQYANWGLKATGLDGYRVANRLKLASADMPRSFFKRWRYRRRVATLQQKLNG
jgi:GT2 family glycosyltransferase